MGWLPGQWDLGGDAVRNNFSPEGCSAPRGHWGMSGHICACHTAVLLAPDGLGPGMLPKPAQCAGRSHREGPGCSVGGAEGKTLKLGLGGWGSCFQLSQGPGLGPYGC